MTEQQARAVADALHGEPHQSGGNLWLVKIRRPDGRIVVLSDDMVCLYADEEAFAAGRVASWIDLV